MEETIEFSGSRSPVTGYLSNESHYGFTLGGKKWPTVEHYMQAQKFVGTQHEETIRKAKTVHQAKRLARERRLLAEEQGKVVKKKAYGKGKEYRMRKDWDVERPKLLLKAMKAKFKQNKRLRERLLETGDSQLKDSSDPSVGPILETIREDLRSRKSKKTEGISSPKKINLYKDLKSSELNRQEKDLVKALVLLSHKISVIEGWDGDIYPGMIEDAVYALARGRKSGLLEEYAKGQKMTWNHVYTKMPRFKKVVNEILSLFGDRLKGDTKEKNRSGMSIAQIIRNLREDTPEKRKEVAQRVRGVLENIEGVKIRFLKKKRAYRKGTPPKIPKRILTQKEKTYIKLAVEETVKSPTKKLEDLLVEVGMEGAMRKKDFDTYVYLTLIKLEGVAWTSEKKDRAFLREQGFSPKTIRYVLKKRKKVRKTLKKTPTPPKPPKKAPQKPPKKAPRKPPQEFLTIRKERENIIVTGKPLAEHAHKLLGMGGRHPRKARQIDRTRIRFPSYLKQDVENYIFQTYPQEKKWEIAKKLWEGNKYLSLLDTSIQVSKLKDSETITKETIDLVVRDIYQCRYSKGSLPQFDLGKDFGKCVQEMLKRRDSLDPEALELLIKYVMVIERGIRKPQQKNLNRIEYLLELDRIVGWGVSKPCPKGSGKLTSTEVCILKALQNLTKTLSIKLKLPVNAGLCKSAFMVLIPPLNLKTGAEQYMDKVLGDLETMTPGKVREKYGLSIGWEPSVASGCPEIFAASIKYISGLLRRPELSGLERRVRTMMGDQPNEACTKYKKEDIKGPKKALVYDEVLEPLGLSDPEYSKTIKRWESLSPTSLLKELNTLGNIPKEAGRTFLSL